MAIVRSWIIFWIVSPPSVCGIFRSGISGSQITPVDAKTYGGETSSIKKISYTPQSSTPGHRVPHNAGHESQVKNYLYFYIYFYVPLLKPRNSGKLDMLTTNRLFTGWIIVPLLSHDSRMWASIHLKSPGPKWAIIRNCVDFQAVFISHQRNSRKYVHKKK